MALWYTTEMDYMNLSSEVGSDRLTKALPASGYPRDLNKLECFQTSLFVSICSRVARLG